MAIIIPDQGEVDLKADRGSRIITRDTYAPPPKPVANNQAAEVAKALASIGSSLEGIGAEQKGQEEWNQKQQMDQYVAQVQQSISAGKPTADAINDVTSPLYPKVQALVSQNVGNQNGMNWALRKLETIDPTIQQDPVKTQQYLDQVRAEAMKEGGQLPFYTAGFQGAVTNAINAKMQQLSQQRAGAVTQGLAEAHSMSLDQGVDLIRKGITPAEMPQTGRGFGPNTGALQKLGSMSSKYEGAKENPIGGFNQDRDQDGNPAGWSYGKYSFNSAKGGLQKFLDSSPEYARKLAGFTPGSPEFNKRWAEIAAAEPERFAAAQDAAAKKGWYDPAIATAQSLGFKTGNRGIQEAVFSGSIQHGGIEKILKRAAERPGFADKDAAGQLKDFYEERTRYYRKDARRYNNEFKDALAYSGSASQVSTADLSPYLASGKDQSHIEGMKPQLRDRLGAMLRDMPPELQKQIKINSGYRSEERQAEIYNEALKKYGSEAEARKWAAPPGKSNHNHGDAADLGFQSEDVRKWVHANAGKYGLKFPLGHEPWHVEAQETRGGTSYTQVADASGTVPLPQGEMKVVGRVGEQGAPLPPPRPSDAELRVSVDPEAIRPPITPYDDLAGLDPKIENARRYIFGKDDEFSLGPLSNQTKRDNAVKTSIRVALEERDANWLKMVPDKWLTPDQRMTMDKISKTIDVAKKQEMRDDLHTKQLLKQQEIDDGKMEILKARASNQQIDVAKYAQKNPELAAFALAQQNQSYTINPEVSARRKARLEDQIFSAASSGNWKNTDLSEMPGIREKVQDGQQLTKDDIFRAVQNADFLTSQDKTKVIEGLSKTYEGANFVADPAFEKAYNTRIKSENTMLRSNLDVSIAKKYDGLNIDGRVQDYYNHIVEEKTKLAQDVNKTLNNATRAEIADQAVEATRQYRDKVLEMNGIEVPKIKLPGEAQAQSSGDSKPDAVPPSWLVTAMPPGNKPVFKGGVWSFEPDLNYKPPAPPPTPQPSAPNVNLNISVPTGAATEVFRNPLSVLKGILPNEQPGEGDYVPEPTPIRPR